jgi:hypothetical protein
VLTVPKFPVAIFPTVAVRVLITDVIALNTEAARFPVTDKLDAVVEPSVDEPLVVRLVAARFVDVLLVIVPLVAEIFELESDGRDTDPDTLKLVMVALVIVALVPAVFVKLEVEAFVVEA